MWVASQVHFLLLLPFYFGYFTAVLSNAYLEQGTYISEQHRYSLATGSTLRLTVFAGLFLCSIFLTARRMAPLNTLRSQAYAAQARPTTKLLAVSILLVVALWLVLLLASGVAFGFPLILRQDRFSYWSAHPFPYLWRILIQGLQLSFLLGVTYGMSAPGRLRRAALLAFCLMLFTNVLFGDKFSSSALALMNFAAAGAIMRHLVFGVRVSLSRWAPRILVAAIAFFVLVSWSYREISNIASQDVVDYIVSRAFGLQGHTWWGIDLLAQQGIRASPAELFQEHSILTPGGLYLLMYAIAPPDAVAFYMSRGMTFTMGGTAIAVHTLGYAVSVPFLILAGILTGAALSYLASKAASVQLWRAWIALKVTWIALLAFNMGNPYLLVGVSMAVYLLIILADLARQVLPAGPAIQDGIAVVR